MMMTAAAFRLPTAMIMLSSPVLAAVPQDTIIPQIQTAGSAERRVAPDLAVLTVSFSADGTTPAEAGRAVAARADSVRDAFVRIGIPRDSLSSVSRRYWWQGRVQSVEGPVRHVTVPAEGNRPAYTYQTRDTLYRAQDAIEIRTGELSLLGAVVDTALAYGITEISNIRYEAMNGSAERAIVLREATRRAREEAEIIAEANGERLGRTLLLTTQDPSGSGRDPFDYVTVRSLGTSRAQAATEIVPPTVQIRVTVYGRWELLRDQ